MPTPQKEQERREDPPRRGERDRDIERKDPRQDNPDDRRDQPRRSTENDR